MPVLKAYARLDAHTAHGLGLDEVPHLALFLQAGDARLTAVDSDMDYGELLLSTPARVMDDFRLPDDRFTRQRDGWPEDWHEDLIRRPDASVWRPRRPE